MDSYLLVSRDGVLRKLHRAAEITPAALRVYGAVWYCASLYSKRAMLFYSMCWSKIFGVACFLQTVLRTKGGHKLLVLVYLARRQDAGPVAYGSICENRNVCRGDWQRKSVCILRRKSLSWRFPWARININSTRLLAGVKCP